ncbi:MAG: ATP-binding protein [Bacteroidales bacterium]|nr:ATP-binding protein [Bacteroidales bacterium]
MKRYFEDFLIKWKNRTTRKPLILRGARQVGKTYLINSFGEKNFDCVIKINFEEHSNLKKLFKLKDTKQILENLSIIFHTKIIPGKTLIFIDEIQASPTAIATLRYFYEQIPQLHVIAAGSLLDHTLNKMQYSMPVGRVEFAYLYPMNFKEFLWALGETELADFIDNYKINDYFAEAIHEKIMILLRRYFFIGGMPEAVKTYSQTGELLEVERIHNNIITSLEYDFAKYGTKTEQQHLITIFRQISKSIGQKIKYVNISKTIRPDAQRNALYKLEMSRIIKLIYHSNAQNSPLEHESKDVFKPMFLDIGLLNHLLQIRLTDTDNLMTVNNGVLAEQFVYQELLTIEPHFIDTKLFYWLRETKNSSAELDALWEHNNKVVPIEVKSGKIGTLKSLYVYAFEMQKKFGVRFYIFEPKIETISTQIRIKAKNENVNFELLSLPLYFTYRLNKLLK